MSSLLALLLAFGSGPSPAAPRPTQVVVRVLDAYEKQPVADCPVHWVDGYRLPDLTFADLVEAERTGAAGTVMTDSHGRATLQGIRETVRVWVRTDEWFGMSESNGEELLLLLRDNTPVLVNASVDLIPLPGLRVSLRDLGCRYSEQGPYVSARTDTTGRAILHDVRAAIALTSERAWKIVPEAAVREEYLLRLDTRAREPLPEELALPLPPMRALEVRVEDESGHAIEEAVRVFVRVDDDANAFGHLYGPEHFQGFEASTDNVTETVGGVARFPFVQTGLRLTVGVDSREVYEPVFLEGLGTEDVGPIVVRRLGSRPVLTLFLEMPDGTPVVGRNVRAAIGWRVGDEQSSSSVLTSYDGDGRLVVELWEPLPRAGEATMGFRLGSLRGQCTVELPLKPGQNHLGTCRLSER